MNEVISQTDNKDGEVFKLRVQLAAVMKERDALSALALAIGRYSRVHPIVCDPLGDAVCRKLNAWEARE